jgi:hypothetical protein
MRVKQSNILLSNEPDQSLQRWEIEAVATTEVQASHIGV